MPSPIETNVVGQVLFTHVQDGIVIGGEVRRLGDYPAMGDPGWVQDEPACSGRYLMDGSNPTVFRGAWVVFDVVQGNYNVYATNIRLQ